MITNTSMKNFVTNNPDLVSMRETNIPGIFVLKYKKCVFYKSLWNKYLELCRGTVVDSDFNIISLPFTKIYNYGIEKDAPEFSDDEEVFISRKVNGFMVAVTYSQVHDELIVSTTGSIDSEHVNLAKSLIDVDKYKATCKQFPEYTFLFECCHPDDPHIIKEISGMYLIGIREKIWDSNIIYSNLRYYENLFDCFVPMSEYIKFGLLKKRVKTVDHEGYVVYGNKKVTKIKSPYYLTLKALARKKDILTLDKKKIDEEYYPLMDHIMLDIENFNNLSEQDRLQYIINYITE